MLKVGLTGGIGSGKTIVSKVFKVIGISVYNADNHSKELMVRNDELRNLLISNFGNEVYNKNGLNTRFLASIVFSDTEKLKTINSIVHPYVRDDFIKWAGQFKSDPYIIEEAAIMFETGLYKEFDKTITVFAPKEIRIKRIMNRDNVKSEDVMKRMKNQMDEDNKTKLADFVIYNNDNNMVIPQVLNIHNQLIGRK